MAGGKKPDLAVAPPPAKASLIVQVLDPATNSVQAIVTVNIAATEQILEQPTRKDGVAVFENLSPGTVTVTVNAGKEFGPVPANPKAFKPGVITDKVVINPGPDPTSTSAVFTKGKGFLRVLVRKSDHKTPLPKVPVTVGTLGTKPTDALGIADFGEVQPGVLLHVTAGNPDPKAKPHFGPTNSPPQPAILGIAQTDKIVALGEADVAILELEEKKLEIVNVDDRDTPGKKTIDIRFAIAGLTDRVVKFTLEGTNYPGKTIVERDLSSVESKDGNGNVIPWNGKIEKGAQAGGFATPGMGPFIVRLAHDDAAHTGVLKDEKPLIMVLRGATLKVHVRKTDHVTAMPKVAVTVQAAAPLPTDLPSVTILTDANGNAAFSQVMPGRLLHIVAGNPDPTVKPHFGPFSAPPQPAVLGLAETDKLVALGENGEATLELEEKRLEIVDVGDRENPGKKTIDLRFAIAGLSGRVVKLTIEGDAYPGKKMVERNLGTGESNDGKSNLISWDGTLEQGTLKGEFATAAMGPFHVRLEHDDLKHTGVLKDEKPFKLSIVPPVGSLQFKIINLGGAPIVGAELGIDGITGVPPLPLTDVNGLSQVFTLPAHKTFRCHAKKAGCDPEPVVGTTEFKIGPEVGDNIILESVVPVRILTLHLREFVAPQLLPTTPLVLVLKKPHTQPKRIELKLSIDVDFDGKGVLTKTIAGTGEIKLFDKLDPATGAEIVFSGNKVEFAGAALKAGVSVFVEGVTASFAVQNITLELSLKDGAKSPRPPVSVKITVAEFTLDICKSRTSATTDPAPLSEADKISKGRFVHAQFASRHGRALLIVRQAQPLGLIGDLVVQPTNGAVQLFAAETGGPPLSAPFEFANATIPATGKQLWVEGVTPSGHTLDTGFTLTFKTLAPEVFDEVKMTVVRFKKLKADIPATTALKARAGNSPVARHEWKIADPAPGADDFNEDYVANKPMVFIENSIPTGDQVRLSVEIEPAGVPVRWAVIRDRRPSPDGDNNSIIALPDNREAPTLSSAAEGLNNTLVANAVGSFHICPFVNCNDGTTFDYMTPDGKRIDREPFIMMNLVLVRVQGVQNDSVGQAANCRSFPAAGQTAANFGGFTTSGGAVWTGANSGWHADAKVDLIGGGNDGRRGLDRVFGGWIQHIFLNGISAQYTVPPAAPGGPALNRSHQYAFIANLPDGVHFGAYHYIGATEVPVNPADGPIVVAGAPILDAAAILDVSPFGGVEGTGGDSAVGSNGFQGGTTGIHGIGYPAPVVQPIGERWQREMWDAPGIGCRSTHITAGGTLNNFRFNLGFRTDLCFWTNTDLKPDQTPNGVANRLYSSVYTCTWTPDFAISFAPVTGLGTVITAIKVDVTKAQSAPNGRASPVLGGMETRAPFALSWYAVDART